ncbi:MAG: hypothetical protein AVDCRST_MAG93-8982 [uncultured Chloroflexia bacterium]|uniref:Uncharacterized protein n=1 Tax=uncultured Chloroflexia bacterium TaxID=1672391 RepID=A0A6J4N9Y7_9CHLR|nr:MAG: hypothetical protein AVDCRST_MAG93-8982 [uncultured Chloroflexia bacterium]
MPIVRHCLASAAAFDVEQVAHSRILPASFDALCDAELPIVQVPLVVENAIADEAVDGTPILDVDGIVAAATDDAVQLSLFGNAMPTLPRRPRSAHGATVVQVATM